MIYYIYYYDMYIISVSVYQSQTPVYIRYTLVTDRVLKWLGKVCQSNM